MTWCCKLSYTRHKGHMIEGIESSFVDLTEFEMLTEQDVKYLMHLLTLCLQLWSADVMSYFLCLQD